MFDDVDEAGLVATIEEATRAEASAAALRSAAIGELSRRRVEQEENRATWACDPWDSAASEIAAAMNISHRRASGQMRIAETLRDHLPGVAELFADGRLSMRVVSTITWRTCLVVENEVWARLDAALVQRVGNWGPWADDRITEAVDALVHRYDAAAVIATKKRMRTRDFVVGDYEDEAGTTSVWGRLHATDGEVLRKRVAAMVSGVCDDDPRTTAERRADAVGAMANGNDHLPCACESPTCPARAQNPPPKSAVAVHVVVDQAAVDGAAGTAVLSGRDMLPTPLVAELVRNGATVRPLRMPCDEPEQGYRPSVALDRWIRARDMTCRFPGCGVPAELCDIDHVIPHPIGPTHPSNLACLCRKHHLLKTFWVDDWKLRLRSDATAVWTSPTGRTYTTRPGSRLWFPEWDVVTADLPPPSHDPLRIADRSVRIPMRKRTRAAERAARINAERAQTDSDTPPF